MSTTRNFVCYDIRRSNSVFRKFENGEDSHHNMVRYENIKFFFHGPKKKGKPGNPFILASEFMSYKSYGLKQKRNDQLTCFLSNWLGYEIDPIILYDMPFNQIREKLIGQCAEIDFKTNVNDNGRKITIIESIRPTDQNIYLIDNLITPLYLLKGVHKKHDLFAPKKQKLGVIG